VCFAYSSPYHGQRGGAAEGNGPACFSADQQMPQWREALPGSVGAQTPQNSRRREASSFYRSVLTKDALNDDLTPFYERYGFIKLPDKPRHLLAPINRIASLFPEEAAGMEDMQTTLQRLTQEWDELAFQ